MDFDVANSEIVLSINLLGQSSHAKSGLASLRPPTMKTIRIMLCLLLPLSTSFSIRHTTTMQRILSSSTTIRPPTRLWSSSTTEEEIDPGMVAGLAIVHYPHPALRRPNVEIDVNNKNALEQTTQLAQRMLTLMYAAHGVGLAAPQVGVNQRLMVYNPTGDATKWLQEV